MKQRKRQLSRQPPYQDDIVGAVSAVTAEPIAQVHQILIAPTREHRVFVDPANSTTCGAASTQNLPLLHAFDGVVHRRVMLGVRRRRKRCFQSHDSCSIRNRNKIGTFSYLSQGDLIKGRKSNGDFVASAALHRYVDTTSETKLNEGTLECILKEICLNAATQHCAINIDSSMYEVFSFERQQISSKVIR